MNFIVFKEEIYSQVQALSVIADKRHVLPILSCIRFEVQDGILSLKASDTETELTYYIPLSDPYKNGKIILHSKKVFQILKTAPKNSKIKFSSLEKNQISLRYNSSSFLLSSMEEVDNFPQIDSKKNNFFFSIRSYDFYQVIKKVQVTMAKNDVRYFLNGLLCEIDNESSFKKMSCIATDGHRMGIAEVPIIKKDNVLCDYKNIIIPYKAINELNRTLFSQKKDVEIFVYIGKSYFKVRHKYSIFISRLISGEYPNYKKVIPENNNKIVVADRNRFKEVLQRMSIFSNEVYRTVRLILESNSIKFLASNSEGEIAEDRMTVNYKYTSMEIGFNVDYLLSIVNSLTEDIIVLKFGDSNTSLLISESHFNTKYILSPISL